MSRLLRITGKTSTLLFGSFLVSCFEHSLTDSKPQWKSLLTVPSDTSILAEQNLGHDFVVADSIREFIEVSTTDIPVSAAVTQGRFSWTPTWREIGNHRLHFQILDRRDSSLKQEVNWNITIRPFTFLYGPSYSDTAILVGQTIQQFLYSTCPKTDSLNLFFSPLPAGLIVTPASRTNSGIASLQWTPDSNQTGDFGFSYIGHNHIEPVRSDTIRRMIRVVADAPANFLKTGQGMATQVGDFSPLVVGSSWVYSHSSGFSIPTASVKNSGQYRISILSSDSLGEWFDLSVEKHTRTISDYAAGSLDTVFQDTNFSLRCHKTIGCGDANPNDIRLPFLLENGAMQHTVYETDSNTKKELWDSSIVYIYKKPISDLNSEKYVSNIGLISGSSQNISQMGPSGGSVQLLEYTPGNEP
jgi:hypothetical protein